MNPDARISTSLPQHPKTLKLARRLGDGACWSLVCLFLWVARNKPSGDLSGMTQEDIEIAANWRGEDGKLYDALVAVRFLDESDDGRCVVIHDWHEHNPWAAGAKLRSAAASDKARRKWGVSNAEVNKQNRAERLAQARAKGRHSAGEWQALLGVCGGACVKCGSTQDVVKDHILPIYKGGSDSIDNLQPLCRSCNSAKGPDETDYRPAGWRECLPNACRTPPPSPSPSPLPIQDQEQKQKPARKRAIETPLPPDFGISDRVAEWAREKGYSRLPEHLAAFRLACEAKGYRYANWDSAFMRAIADDWARLRTADARAGPRPDATVAKVNRLEELKRGLVANGNPDGAPKALPLAVGE